MSRSDSAPVRLLENNQTGNMIRFIMPDIAAGSPFNESTDEVRVPIGLRGYLDTLYVQIVNAQVNAAITGVGIQINNKNVWPDLSYSNPNTPSDNPYTVIGSWFSYNNRVGVPIVIGGVPFSQGDTIRLIIYDTTNSFTGDSVFASIAIRQESA